MYASVSIIQFNSLDPHPYGSMEESERNEARKNINTSTDYVNQKDAPK